MKEENNLMLFLLILLGLIVLMVCIIVFTNTYSITTGANRFESNILNLL